MNLYYISQTENTGYETYDSAVVAAQDEISARFTHPGNDFRWKVHADGSGAWITQDINGEDYESSGSTWASCPGVVTSRLIGVASSDIAAGVICASFHAG